MAYDSQKQKAILFGGTIYDVKLFNDPWEQDPAGWTQVVDTGPSPRSRHSMVYDENRKKIDCLEGTVVYSSNRIVLFGGTTFSPRGRTY